MAWKVMENTLLQNFRKDGFGTNKDTHIMPLHPARPNGMR